MISPAVLPGDPERIVDRAIDLRAAGRTAEALALVRAGIEAHPRHARLRQVLGVIHRDAQDAPKAVAAFGEAARLAPADPRIAFSLAQASLEAGFPATALFDRARGFSPTDGGLLIGRAAAQLAEGQDAQAVADLDTVLAGNPHWLEGHATLARIRWLTGDREDHLAGYRRALAAAPESLALWLAMIDLQLQAERFAEADASIAAARAATGADLDAFEVVAASELGDHARAGRLYARLAALPEMGMVVRHIRHLLRTGRADEAAARAEPFLHHADADQLWPYVGTIWRLTGDPRLAWLEDDERLVGVYDLADRLPLDALAERLRGLHTTRSYPIGQSVRGGTQTDGPLFARAEPEIRALREVLRETVAAHVRTLGKADPAHPVLRKTGSRFRFAGSWSVRLAGDQAHHTFHVHPQGWLSSACYITVPGAEEMGEAPAGRLALGQPPAELGIDLPPTRIVEPKPGRLVLFPSTLWHGTMPFARGERMSVAFDIASTD